MSRYFPATYDAVMAPLERGGFAAIRRDLLRQATGTVLEIGSGTGVNFPVYQQADRVVAIEPDSLMVRQSLPRAKSARMPIDLVLASAEMLPFPDKTFDTIVATLVFCSVHDPGKALSEVRRVLKPNGKALFFEHVRLNRPVLGRLQDVLTPIWKRLCGGCHLNRDTLALIQRAGFRVTRVAPHYRDIFLVIKTDLQTTGSEYASR